ncbi:MAG: hypothetical protein ACLFPS_05855 [Clostridia bacterium]
MKVWNYMAIMLTMMVFLYFLGFSPAGVSDTLEDTGIKVNSTTGQLIEGNTANSAWYNKLFSSNGLLLLVGAGGALIVGFFTRQFEWKILLIPFFTLFVGNFVSFGWSLVNLAQSTGETWLVGIVATVFLPLTAMFLFSVVEWFGGTGG